jgi:hypothetical protein
MKAKQQRYLCLAVFSIAVAACYNMVGNRIPLFIGGTASKISMTNSKAGLKTFESLKKL